MRTRHALPEAITPASALRRVAREQPRRRFSEASSLRRRIASFQPMKVSRFWRVALVASLVLWVVVIVPSGLDPVSLLVFTAPAAALGIFLRWASCLFTPSRWNWRMAAHAAIASAMLLPPVLAALVALAGLQRPEALLPLFVLGAWIALAVGLLAAALAPATKNPIHSREPLP